MYTLKRREKITEQVKLGDEVLSIEIVPEEIAREYNKVQVEIIQTQDAIRKAQGAPSAELLEQYGMAIIKLFSILFGQENTEKLLVYYEDNYVEMSTEVMPFIVDVIKPQLDKAITAMRERTREIYKKAKYGAKYNLGDKFFGKR